MYDHVNYVDVIGKVSVNFTLCLKKTYLEGKNCKLTPISKQFHQLVKFSNYLRNQYLESKKLNFEKNSSIKDLILPRMQPKESEENMRNIGKMKPSPKESHIHGFSPGLGLWVLPLVSLPGFVVFVLISYFMWFLL